MAEPQKHRWVKTRKKKNHHTIRLCVVQFHFDEMSRTVLSIAAEETTVTAGLEGGRGEAVIANRNEVYLLG